MKKKIRLIHLSDMHFQSNSDHGIYSRVKDALSGEDIPPDIFLVSGDIVDNEKPDFDGTSLREAFSKAYIFLKDLCEEFKLVPEKRLFVVPGNHDLRLLGNKYSRKSHKIFNEIFDAHRKTKYISELNTIVACFNSNLTNDNFSFAAGEVLSQEFSEFERSLKKIKKEIPDSEYALSNKIALLHHHPMPILRSEYKKDIKWWKLILSRKSTVEEKFLVLNNSATFMNEIIRHDFNLIIHGHKHHRGVSKASFPLKPNYFKNIAVISAGSIGKPTEDDELSFNIIDILDNRQVKVSIQVKRGEGGYRKSLESTDLFDEKEMRMNRFENSKRVAISSAKNVIFSDRVIRDTGDYIRHGLVKNWIPIRGKLEKINTEMSSSSALFTKKPKITVLHPENFGADWLSDGIPEDGIQKGYYRFRPKMSQDKLLIAEIRSENPNAISFTTEQRLGFIRKRESAENTEDTSHNAETADSTERVYWNFSNVLPEHLIWRIKFPDNFALKNQSIRVLDKDDQSDDDEQSYCLENFHYLKERNEIVLKIDYPLPELNYEITWNLPSEIEFRAKTMRRQDFQDFEDIRELLLSVQIEDSLEGGAIRKFLEDLHSDIKKIKFLDGNYDNIPLEISISAYDEKNSEIKYIGFFCPECEDQINSTLWEDKTAIGHPITGYVFKSRRACFQSYPRKPDRYTRKYIRIPACKSYETNIRKKDFIRSFFAIPISYPLEYDNVVAVIELATCGDHKMLYDLTRSKNPAQQYAKRQSVGDFINIRFIDFIDKWKNEKIINS